MDKLVGVTVGLIWGNVGQCVCSLSDIDGVSANDYTEPSPVGLRTHGVGTGPVLTVGTGGVNSCWRNEVS